MAAMTAQQRAQAEENCAELITIDQDGGILTLVVDGAETVLNGGYVSTEVQDDKVYVYVSAWFCSDRVEIIGTPDSEEDDDDEEPPTPAR